MGCKKKKLKKAEREKERETLTVQAHIMEGEDGGPAGGSCAVEGHVQDTMRGLDTVLLRGGRGGGI